MKLWRRRKNGQESEAGRAGDSASGGKRGSRSRRGRGAVEEKPWYHQVPPLFEEPLSDEFPPSIADTGGEGDAREEASVQVVVERTDPVVVPPDDPAPEPDAHPIEAPRFDADEHPAGAPEPLSGEDLRAAEAMAHPYAAMAESDPWVAPEAAFDAPPAAREEPAPPMEPEAAPEPEPEPPHEAAAPPESEPPSEAQPEPEPAPETAPPEAEPPAPQRPFVHDSAAATAADPPMIIPVRAHYLTRADDTLRSVAAQFLNAPARWQELRSLNAAYPGIANLGPDAPLPVGSSLALPGDPLPWGKPDPVYLWTLAETFLYTAWGREPSPEEVVPFWRGLTSGAKHLGAGPEAPPAIGAAIGAAAADTVAEPPIPPAMQPPAAPPPEAAAEAPEAPPETEPEAAAEPPHAEPAAETHETTPAEAPPAADLAPDEPVEEPAAVLEVDAEPIEPEEPAEVPQIEAEPVEPEAEWEAPSAPAVETPLDDAEPSLVDAEPVESEAPPIEEPVGVPEVEAEPVEPVAEREEPPVEEPAAAPEVDAEPVEPVVETPLDDAEPSLVDAEPVEWEAPPIEEPEEVLEVEAEPAEPEAEWEEPPVEEPAAVPEVDAGPAEPVVEWDEPPADEPAEVPEVEEESVELEAPPVPEAAAPPVAEAAAPPVEEELPEPETPPAPPPVPTPPADEVPAPPAEPPPPPVPDPPAPPYEPPPPPVPEPPAPPYEPPPPPVPEPPAPAYEPPPPQEADRYEPPVTPAPGFEPMPGLPDLGPVEPPMQPVSESEVPSLPAFMPSVTSATPSAELPVEEVVASSQRILAGTAIGDAMMLWQLGRVRRRRGAARGEQAPDPVELSLEQTARVDALQLIEAAMRHLRAVTVAQLRPRPRVVCVRTGTYGFEVLLDEPVEAPEGWRSAAGGYVLELPRTVTVEQLDAVGDGPSLCPALVPVGDTAEGPLLLNVEEIGCLALAGPNDATASLLTSVVETLGSSPLAGDIRIITVGISAPSGAGWERVHAINYDSPQLEHLLSTALSPAHAGAGSVDVLVVGPGHDLLFQRAGHIATTPGSRLVLVGATSSAAAKWPWRIHVDESFRAVVHPIAVTISASQAMRPELAYLLREAADDPHTTSRF